MRVEARPEGNDYVIRWCDEGVGMEPHQIQEIFQPFKAFRKGGTGLGLAVVYSIVSDHRGEIGVDSRSGKGTTFTLRHSAGGGVSGQLLVVDDEPNIRELLRIVLEGEGYTVSEAADLREGDAAARPGEASTSSSATSSCPTATASTSSKAPAHPTKYNTSASGLGRTSGQR